QQKTGRPVQFELMSDARSSLFAWLERRGGTVDDYAFPSRIDPTAHMSTRQYARLVDEWVEAIGLRPQEYGTHSLRRTKASIIYKATGNLRAVQILLGHTKIENTVRYLGVDVEDALELAEATEVDQERLRFRSGAVNDLRLIRSFCGAPQAFICAFGGLGRRQP
ncbi:tyrosine-type recombinase/integrase, partial [Mesorhizobium sp. PL10]